MPIVTLCKSCKSISLLIVDRCSWCGSRKVRVEMMDQDDIQIKRGRQVLREEVKGREDDKETKRPRTQTEET